MLKGVSYLSNWSILHKLVHLLPITSLNGLKIILWKGSMVVFNEKWNGKMKQASV